MSWHAAAAKAGKLLYIIACISCVPHVRESAGWLQKHTHRQADSEACRQRAEDSLLARVPHSVTGTTR